MVGPTPKYTNFARTSLEDAIDDTDLTINVTNGGVFPSENFFIIVEPNDEGSREIIFVGSRSGNVLTVTSILNRGREGTTATSHDAGVQIINAPTSRDLSRFWQDNLFDKVNNGIGDEFDDRVFSGWTLADQPTGNAVSRMEDNDLLSCLVPGGGDGTYLAHAMWRPLTAPYNTFPLTIEVCYRWVQAYATNYRMSGIVLGTTNTWNTGNQLWNMNYTSSGNAGFVQASVRRFTSYTGDGATYFNNQLQIVGPFAYNRIRWTAANTFYWDISPDGVQWLNYGGAMTWNFTPTYFGIGDSSWGTATQSIVSYEYIRVY